MTKMFSRAFLTTSLVASGALAATFAIGPLSHAEAQGALPKVRVGVMAAGTVKWELTVMKTKGLDQANGFELVITDYATGDAADIAINANQVEVIAKDFLVVSALRAQRLDYTWVPHSAAVGGIIVRKDSGINSVNDLAGKAMVVAPNALDKSYILLRAWTQARLGKDVTQVARSVTFAASPLANDALVRGTAQAIMNLWNWNARLLADPGYRQLIGTEDILKDLDPSLNRKLPLIGWVFHESWARANNAALTGFLRASRATKDILLKDDAVWMSLRENMLAGITGTDAVKNAVFNSLRDQYRRGIVTSFTDGDRRAAEKVFSILAKIGGEDLVGKSPTLSPGTFRAEMGF
jgi:NitT/TauT family transport system substrate-binding protein